MKKILFILCLAYTSVFGQNWQLVWSDEFDYWGVPDNTKWSFDTDGNNGDWGNNEAQNYTRSNNKNAWVEDGNLVIEARKESYYWEGDGETKSYTSARLVTNGKAAWLYGKIEVRALLPTGRGVWPAIWMLPTDWEYGNWPSSGELDIMENVGYDPTSLHCNIHTEAYNHMYGTNKGNTVSISDPYYNWHVYGMIWTEHNVSFYCDDELVFSFEKEYTDYKSWPFDKRFHLILNIAVGGSWGGSQGIDDDIFPQRMLVDYVRVYQDDPPILEPYNGIASIIPGIIESENYDLGGEGIAYFDATLVNELGEYRNDHVGIEKCSEGGYNLGYLKEGEWLKYTVNVTESSLYEINFRTASLEKGGRIRLQFNNKYITETVNLNVTYDWQSWQTTTVPLVYLEKGEYVMTVYIEQGDFNLNYIEFKQDKTTTGLQIMNNDQADVYLSHFLNTDKIEIGNLKKGDNLKIISESGILEKEVICNASNLIIDVSPFIKGFHFVIINENKLCFLKK